MIQTFLFCENIFLLMERLCNNNGKVFSYDELGNINRSTDSALIIDYLDEVSPNRISRIRDASNNKVVGIFKCDSIGNPTSYNVEPNNQIINMCWEHGRQLLSYQHRSKGLSKFFRDIDGKIARKVVMHAGSEITKIFYYEGNKLIAENWSNNVSLYYEYDESGVISITQYMLGVTHNFIVIKDALGNVRQLRHRPDDGSPELAVVTYEYDAFGNIVKEQRKNYHNSAGRHIANQNPWRWKGHYFDVDTDFYIINNENYDPKFGRFINPVDYSGMLDEPWLSSYVAFKNNFVMAQPNPHNFHSYFPVVNQLQLNPRRSWFVRVWGEMPTWLQVVLGGVALVASAITAIATGSKSLILTKKGRAVSAKITIVNKLSSAMALTSAIYSVFGAVTGGLGRGDGWCWIGAGEGFGQGAVAGAIIGAGSIIGKDIIGLSGLKLAIFTASLHAVTSTIVQAAMQGEIDFVKVVTSGIIGGITSPIGDLERLTELARFTFKQFISANLKFILEEISSEK